jgi:hypothetical protein
MFSRLRGLSAAKALHFLTCCATVGLGQDTACAEEGMWTLSDFPRERLSRKYGFQLSDEWLKNAQLASVRLANGCSGALVSRQGLIVTNHHCVSECLSEQTSATRDLARSGFYAPNGAAELPCSSLEVHQLVDMEDVTQTIQTATRGLTEAEFGAALRREISNREQACAEKTKLRCDVVSLYHGGKYHLYKYRRFSDVRLVFLPETQAARFGGDPDNFNYPRYALDVSFLRVYENGKPLQNENAVPVSPKGVSAGDLVFATGNPGSTNRLLTLSQLEFLRDVSYPEQLLYLSGLRGHLLAFAKQSAENQRIALEPIYSVENYCKSLLGQHETLASRMFMKAKQASEETLRAQIQQNPTLEKRFGGAWDALSRATDERRKIHLEHTLIEGGQGFQSTLFQYARHLVRAAEERQKPSGQRLTEYRDSALPSLSHELLAKGAIYPAIETLTLSYSLGFLRERLGPDHPFVKEVFGAYSPEEIARNLVSGSRLYSPAVRRALWEGGEKAVGASQDPMIRFAKAVDLQARLYRRQHELAVETVEKRNAELLAQALFAVLGTGVYPDATFTLRMTYGTVSGFKAFGQDLAPMTLLGGAFVRHTGRFPFVLPPSWVAAKTRLNPQTPLNFTSTLDIVGGNSGSPVLDKEGHVVGVVFDGNLPSLGGAFYYDDLTNRAVSVHSAGLLELLDKVYGAGPLLAELKAALPTSAKPGQTASK